MKTTQQIALEATLRLLGMASLPPVHATLGALGIPVVAKPAAHAGILADGMPPRRGDVLAPIHVEMHVHLTSADFEGLRNDAGVE